MARAGLCFHEPRYIAAAQRCARFLLDTLRKPDGRLLHVWRQGIAETDGFLDDYAYLIQALVSLNQVDQDADWLESAVELANQMRDHFGDAQGGFYFTADDSEVLIARVKDQLDNSVPSGNGMAATALVRLGLLVHDDAWIELARRTLDSSLAVLRRASLAGGQSFLALDWLIGPATQCLLVVPPGVDVMPLRSAAYSCYLPRLTWMEHHLQSAEVSPRVAKCFEGRASVDSQQPTLYICSGQTCQPPIVGHQAILAAIATLQTGKRL
jgi:uncharacterized protein YyaL (SSP411 family)